MATNASTYEELLKENEELKAQIQTTQQNQTQYQTPTTPEKYVSPYAQELESLAGELKNSTFQYSKQEDPNWQALRKEYLLQADRTADDVLAKASVNTGGRASSYAVTAASQAANDLRASLTQEEQGLYDEAYSRYYTEYSKKLQDYENLMNQDQQNYDRWSEEQALAQEQKDQAYERLVTLIASTGHTPTEEELTAAGMSAGEAASWKSYYQTQLALSQGSGGGGGSYYSSGSSGGTETGSGSGGSSLLDRIDEAYNSGGYSAALKAVDDAYSSGEIVGVGGLDTTNGAHGKSAYNTYVSYLESGVDTSSWSIFAQNTYNNLLRSQKQGKETAASVKKYLDNYVSLGKITKAEANMITKALGY